MNRKLASHPLILPLYLPALLISVAQGVVMPVLPLYARSFDAPYFWVGVLLAGDGLGLLVGDIPAGIVMRRLDRRRGMLLGLSLVGLATLALFWARTLPEALLFRFLSGLGVALYNVARLTYVADTITVATRGQSVALLGATFRLGRMVGPAIGGSLAVTAGLRAPFLVYAGICGLAALAIYVVNRGSTSREQAPRAVGAVTPRAILRGLRGHARLIAAPGAGQFLMQMLRNGPPVILPLYASTVLGLDVQQIGWIFSISSLVDALLFYPTGLIMDRLGRKWAIVPSTLVMAAGLALVPFATSFLGLLAAAVINGFGNGLGSGVMITLGADLAPAGARGEFLGLWGLVGDAGASSGPVLAGAVTDLLALQPAAWVIAASGVAAALVFGLLVPETLARER